MLKVNRGIIKKLGVSNPFELFSRVDYARGRMLDVRDGKSDRDGRSSR